ncbi:uncharacterized protein LOC128252270 [Drosophila gunungcola]|uniref:Uncharacterized protein n=1 Tax=Drosophila gunungcola TaxID=103775 RepID=A0A9Q0BTT8_9MUSC|nr:uncharacterized protein LOC128252270 [Drosophila gunungcola]KAI8043941.1 hypothetical protein M5D96_000089 [Drosophila gunungcola]
MSQALVNEETLEAMAYERSMVWSSVLKDFSNMGDGMELDVAQFDDLFQDEDDENPDLQDEEEAAEDDVPDAKLELGHINTTTASVAELTLLLCAGKDDETKAEIEEFLNQTVPVVEGHKRKWREAGLDRILDTFDEKQIEHHVGSWMRRHNNVYLEATSPKYLHSEAHSISDQSDESLHSIDTARYIQQSRRRKAHLTSKNSNMTTIKMYRKNPHKRDELRAKYAYDDEQEHRHHMQALLHRRQEKERQLAYLASTPMHCIHSSSPHVRRKHLRKRRANSWLCDSSLSSEEGPSFNGCDCQTCRRHHALSRSAYQYCPYSRSQREYHHRQAASRTVHTARRHHTFDMDLDLRPRLPENECSCCNSERLCSNVVHIANSSTEEWVVENRSSPELLEAQVKARKHKQQLVAPQSARSKFHEQRVSKIKAASASKLVRSKANCMPMFDSDTSDEDRTLEKWRLFNFSERIKGKLITTPKTSGKTTQYIAFSEKKVSKKAYPVTSKCLPQIKEEKSTLSEDIIGILSSGESEGLSIPKLTHLHAKCESSDESEVEIKGRKRLVSFSVANAKTIRAPFLNLPHISENEALINTKVSHAQIEGEYSEKKQANKEISIKSSAPLVTSAKKCNQKAITAVPSSFPQVEEKAVPLPGSGNKKAKKTITTPLIKENKKDKGSNIPKKIHARIESKTSDECDEEVLERKRNVKSKCPAAKKTSKQTTNPDENSTLPQIPKELTNYEILEMNSSSSSTSHEILNKNPVVSREKPKKSSSNIKIIAESEATEKASTPQVKKTKRNSGKKKIVNPTLPQLIEEVPNRSSDSQTKPEQNRSLKVPKTNLKKSRSSITEVILEDNTNKESDSEVDVRKALALSKATYKEEQLKRRKAKKQTSKEQDLPPIEQSLSIFNNQSVACNSTALANDTACNRVLPKRRTVKRAAAVSSTQEQAATNDSTSPTGSSVPEVGATSGDPDCTVVTSTTCCEPPSASEPIRPPLKLTKRGILLRSSTEPDAGNFTLTEQALGNIIGERWARKYLKYHIGSRSFDSRHSVYYQPTPQLAAALSAPQDVQQTLANISSSSSGSSDDDIFEQFNRYGTVYSVLEKTGVDKAKAEA